MDPPAAPCRNVGEPGIVPQPHVASFALNRSSVERYCERSGLFCFVFVAYTSVIPSLAAVAWTEQCVLVQRPATCSPLIDHLQNLGRTLILHPCHRKLTPKVSIEGFCFVLLLHLCGAA